MKIESVYRIIVLVMLGSILAVQVMLLNQSKKPVKVIVQNGVEVHSAPFHW